MKRVTREIFSFEKKLGKTSQKNTAFPLTSTRAPTINLNSLRAITINAKCLFFERL